MCGIVGIFNASQTSQNVELFEKLLYADVFRGFHSTGVFRLDEELTGTLTFKKAVAAPAYLCEKGWEGLKGVSSGTASSLKLSPLYVGHNRHATVGEKTDENSHPFTVGKITMVHNGSVSKTQLSNGSQFAVDSHAICDLLDKKGLEEALKEMDGAFALVWWNSEEKTLNFFRNDERPLRINRYTDGTYVWASEGDMLDWIMTRKGTKNAVVKTLARSFELPVGMLYKLHFDGKTITDLGMEKKTLPTFTYNYNYNRNYGGYSSSSYKPKSKKERYEESFKEAGIDLSMFLGNIEEAYLLLDNISYTKTYASSGTLEAELSFCEDSLNLLEEAGIEIDGYINSSEQAIAKAYSVTNSDWDKLKDEDEIYAHISSVYKTTTNGKQVLTFTVDRLTSKVPEGKEVDVLNTTFLDFLEKATAPEQSTALTVPEKLEANGNVDEKDEELDKVLTNQSGTQKTIRIIRKMDFNCGLCGDPIDETEYPDTYTWSEGSTICTACTRYTNAV